MHLRDFLTLKVSEKREIVAKFDGTKLFLSKKIQPTLRCTKIFDSLGIN